MMSRVKNREFERDLEEFGDPPMDLSKMNVSSSCSEGGGTTSVDASLTSPCTVHARHLLKVLKLFHKDHVQLVSGIRDGFLGYHVKNFSPRNNNVTSFEINFNEMGFVYDSVLSKSYGRSCILEMVRVDFSQGRTKPGARLKRSLSLDDLDIIAQRNYKLDRKTLYLLGVDTNTRYVHPRAVCDGGHFSKNIKCRFSRCTTILQDDCVLRKLTFLKDGTGCIERESTSTPRFSSVEPLKMVDEYYSMQYAEKLFNRCKIGYVWENLDFVHKKWLGELIDEESMLVSNNLKNVYLQLAHGDGIDTSVKTEGYNPEYQSMKMEGRINRGSSLGSLNNMLVEGMAVFNDKLDDSEDPARMLKKCSRKMVHNGSMVDNHSECFDTSCEYHCYECTMGRGDILSNKSDIRGRKLQGSKKCKDLVKVWSSFKRRGQRPTRKKYYGKTTVCRKKKTSWRNRMWNDTETISEISDGNVRVTKSRRSWRGEREKRKSALKVEKWVNEKGNGISGDTSEIISSSEEIAGLARKSNDSKSGAGRDESKKKLNRGGKKTAICFKKKTSVSGSNGNSGEESSTASTSSVTSFSSTDKPDKTITTAVTEASTVSSSTSKGSEATLSKAVTTKKLVKASRSAQQVQKKKSRSKCTISNLVLRLLAREVQDAQGRQEPLKKREQLTSKYDSYIELKNFCVVFKEAQVLRSLVHEDTVRQPTMTDKIVKAIDDCKLACIKICKSSTSTEADASSDDMCGESSRTETNEVKSPSCGGDDDSTPSDVIPDERPTSRRVVLLSDDDTCPSATTSVTASSTLEEESSPEESGGSGARASQEQSLEKSGYEPEVEESATTDAFEEEALHTNETFHLHKSIAHVAGNHSCRCEECVALFREVMRLMGSDKVLRSSSKRWRTFPRTLPLKRVLNHRRWLSGVRHTSSPKTAVKRATSGRAGRSQQVAAAATSSGAERQTKRDDDEKKIRSKSESDVKDYMEAPKQEARKFLSLRKIAVVRGQKKRPKNSDGAVYKVRSKAAKCRKSTSSNSRSSKKNLLSRSGGHAVASPPITPQSSRTLESSDATGPDLSPDFVRKTARL